MFSNTANNVVINHNTIFMFFFFIKEQKMFNTRETNNKFIGAVLRIQTNNN